MQTWIFEPGHTAAHFMARHMMVTRVRGHFTDVHGRIEFDPAEPTRGTVEARIDATTLWTGEAARDEHLKSEDFLDVGAHPELLYRGEVDRAIGWGEFRVAGELTLRGETREVPLHVRYLGSWDTPYWQDGRDRGPVRRLGFEATTTIDRQDFGVAWNGTLDCGGVVVSDEIGITIDVEALESGVIDGI